MISLSSCLHFSQETCSLKNYASVGQTKTFGIRRHIFLGSSLSSCNTRQGHWNIYVTDKIRRPINHVSFGKDVFTCRSFMPPGSMNGNQLMKSATVALTRSFSALHESPMLAQIIPAIGLVAFAIWGLGPLMRHSRNLFLQGNDANWKKSKTYFVCTSYLQPLLLWTGSILICRVLDQVVLHSEASQAVKRRLLNFVKSLSTVMAFAYCLSSLIQQMQKFFMEANEFNDTRNMGFQFASKAVYTAVWVAAVSLFMELLGFSTQKWLTAGGFGTVLLTLAGREIFTNFLSSVMIHATRPFVLNEWIQTKIEGYEVSGTVEHVGWWSPTIIRGDDREAVHIPNHKFTVNVVRNLSQKTHWRVKTHFAISHLDANKISNIVADMRKVLSKNSQVEQQRLHRRVFLEYIDTENQAFMILISCFVKTSHFEEYLCVKEGILLDLLRVISHHRARLATPIRTVQKIYGDADLENVPFAETIITRGGTSVNRPLYLIDTTLRINGDDKAKPRPTSRANEEQSSKASVTSDQKAAALSSDDSSSEKQQQEKIEDNDETLSRSDGSAQNEFQSEKLQQKVKSPLSSNSSTRSQPEAANKVGLNSKDIKGAAVSEKPSTSQLESGSEQGGGGSSPGVVQSRYESEKTPITTQSPVSRTSLEENIVLGVALDGSKRTLPIDEGIISPSSPVEAKELAALRNGNGSSSSVKKHTQIPASPGGTSSEQRDQEK